MQLPRREPDPGRLPKKQTACTECRKRKKKCVFRQPGDVTSSSCPPTVCISCSKRFPPVECRTARDDAEEAAEETIETALPIRGGEGMPPAVHPAWLRTEGARASPSSAVLVSGRRRPLSRSGSNLVLDGGGDPSALRPFGGILSAVNTLNSMPLQQTIRNVELLHFYLRFVVPNLVSIDGESQPAVFVGHVLPWQLQSPIFPNIGLLMACAAQSLDRGVLPEKNTESLSMKARALANVGRFLRQHVAALGARGGDGVQESLVLALAEAIKCVINLVVMEWFWGTDDNDASMKAHMRGIRDMIGLGGGIRRFMATDPVAAAVVILTDYEIACGFELDVFWQARDGPLLEDEIPVPRTWSAGFDCPLVPADSAAGGFRDNMAGLGIGGATADILDAVRDLTVMVTVADVDPAAAGQPSQTTRICATAEALLDTLGLADDATIEDDDDTALLGEQKKIGEAVCLAAAIYCRAVATRTLASRLLTEPADAGPPLAERLYSAITAAGLASWKKTPGIFLWVMLVLCPSTNNSSMTRDGGSDSRRRRAGFIRRKMAVTGLSIGFEDFALGISYLRAFWRVQRWIVREASPITSSTGFSSQGTPVDAR